MAVVLDGVTFQESDWVARGHLGSVSVGGTAYQRWEAMWVAGINEISTRIGQVGGLGVAMAYAADTGSTADAAPGDGLLTWNNATQGSATVIYLDADDANGVDISGLIDTFDDSTSTIKGTLRIAQRDDNSKWILYAVTAVTSASGYRKLTVSAVGYSAASPFADAANLTLTFSRTGDRGWPANGARWTFSTTTTDGDPGAGTIRLNSATQNAATQAFLDLTDADGATQTGWLDGLDDASGSRKGQVRFAAQSDPSRFISGVLTAVTSATGYRKLAYTVQASSAANPFTNGEALFVSFQPAGDTGGVTGGTMTGNLAFAGYDATGVGELGADTVTAGTASVADLSVEWATVSEAGETAVERARDVSGDVIMTSRSAPVMAITLVGDTTLLVAGPETGTPPNLLLQSDDMRTAAEAGEASRPWSANSSTVRLAAAVNYDGRMTMSHLIEAAASAIHLRGQTATGVAPSQTLTVSVPVGSDGSGRNILIKVYDADASGNGIEVIVNPATGAVVSAAANSGNATGAAATVTALPNSRYRIDLTGKPNTSGSNTAIQVMLANGSSVDYLGDGASGVYIGRVQLSIGQPPADLWGTGASLADWSYQREVRITQGGSGGYACAILPAQQLTYSDDLQSTAEAGGSRPWSDDRTSLQLDAAVGHDGRETLQHLIEDADSSLKDRYQTITGLAPSQTLTWSVIVRSAGASRNVRLFMSDADAVANAVTVIVDPTTGAIVEAAANAGNATGATATVTALSNSCVRVDLSGKPNTSGSNTRVQVQIANGTTLSYTGDGTSGFYIGNVQLNKGGPLPMMKVGATRAGVVSWRIADDEVDFPSQAAGVETRLLIDVTPDAILIDDVSKVS